MSWVQLPASKYCSFYILLHRFPWCMNTQFIPLLIERNSYLLCWLHLPVSYTLSNQVYRLLAELSNSSYPEVHCLTVQASSFPHFNSDCTTLNKTSWLSFKDLGVFSHGTLYIKWKEITTVMLEVPWHGISICMFATCSVNYLKSYY